MQDRIQRMVDELNEDVGGIEIHIRTGQHYVETGMGETAFIKSQVKVDMALIKSDSQ